MTTPPTRSPPARITRYTHSCVRIERNGTVLVGPTALDAAAAFPGRLAAPVPG